MCKCSIDVRKHIEELEQELALLDKKETLTPEEEERWHELRRKIYRSKARNRCC